MKNILDRVNGRLRTLVSNKLYSNYGQMDEDKVISGLFNNKKTGFFVDIGANHPYKINNTYKFYLKGWRGINIEPISENVKLLKKYRPKDKTLQIGISDKRGFLTFYQFNDHVLSTFSKKLADS